MKLESDNLARLPFLRTWFRTRSAIVLHLNNGTLQVQQMDFTQIHHSKETKSGAITYQNNVHKKVKF